MKLNSAEILIDHYEFIRGDETARDRFVWQLIDIAAAIKQCDELLREGLKEPAKLEWRTAVADLDKLLGD